MATNSTSGGRRSSGKLSWSSHRPFSSPLLKDPKGVAETLLECIRSDDLNSFREVLAAHIMTSENKSALAKKAKISRRKLYDILDESKVFNPELSTVSALIRALAA